MKMTFAENVFDIQTFQRISICNLFTFAYIFSEKVFADSAENKYDESAGEKYYGSALMSGSYGYRDDHKQRCYRSAQVYAGCDRIRVLHRQFGGRAVQTALIYAIGHVDDNRRQHSYPEEELWPSRAVHYCQYYC